MGTEKKQEKKNLEAERLLEEAKNLQGEFWDKLSELEAEIGCDVDANTDLEDETVESLKAK